MVKALCFSTNLKQSVMRSCLHLKMHAEKEDCYKMILTGCIQW